MTKWLVMGALLIGSAGLGIYSKYRPNAKSGQCHSLLDYQIAKSLKELKDQKSNRSGVFSLVLPSDEDEYNRLNKMAVLAVTLISTQKKDLPIKRVYAVSSKEKGKLNVLPSIFPRSVIKKMPEDSEVGKKLGQFRQDVFLFIPIRFLVQSGELSVLFNDSITNLTIGRFPLKLDLEFLGKRKFEKENNKVLPEPKLVISLLKENFCL